MKKKIKAPDEQHLRYSKIDFPPYRFIPGETLHPTENPHGHSYGKEDEGPEILDEKSWYENETYLFGVDLYNYAFWWESHEAFESLWKKVPKDGLTSNFFQGLIKISAAFFKWHLKQQRGCETLYSGGIVHLQKVLDNSTEYMGLNLMNHIAKVSIHFREVIAEPNQWPDPFIDYPFIVLEEAK